MLAPPTADPLGGASTWLTLKQAIAYTGRSATVIRRACVAGELRAAKRTPNSPWTMRRAEVDRWMDGA